MYFKSGKLMTAVLTIGFALFPTLLATKRLPSILTKVTGGLGRFIDIETFLAVRETSFHFHQTLTLMDMLEYTNKHPWAH